MEFMKTTDTFFVDGNVNWNRGLSVSGTDKGSLVIYSCGQKIMEIEPAGDINMSVLNLKFPDKGQYKPHLVINHESGRYTHQLQTVRPTLVKEEYKRGEKESSGQWRVEVIGTVEDLIDRMERLLSGVSMTSRKYLYKNEFKKLIESVFEIKK